MFVKSAQRMHMEKTIVLFRINLRRVGYAAVDCVFFLVIIIHFDIHFLRFINLKYFKERSLM